MNEKNEKQFNFQLDLQWLTKRVGVISAEDAEGTIQVATPPIFGGEGRPWTPEHLFLGALSSCFMTTYLSFVQKFKFEIAAFSCEAKGTIGMVDGRLVFTGIDLYPKISIPSVEFKEKANLALEKTKKYCIISNSVYTKPNYHCELIVQDQPGILTEMNMNKTA